MKTATGREIVVSMMQLGTNMARWNKENATKDRVRKRIEELGLTHHQIEIMGFLYQNPETNTISAISTELLISKGSLSLMLSKLQVAGFVRKVAAQGDDDGRKVYVSLTEKGEKALLEIQEYLVEDAAIIFDQMEPERRKKIYQKVIELMELLPTGGWKR